MAFDPFNMNRRAAGKAAASFATNPVGATPKAPGYTPTAYDSGVKPKAAAAFQAQNVGPQAPASAVDRIKNKFGITGKAAPDAIRMGPTLTERAGSTARGAGNKALSVTGRLGAPIALAMEFPRVLNEAEASGTQEGSIKALGKGTGRVAAAAAGGKLGAAAGTAIGGPVGTAVGGLAGAAIGYKAGEAGIDYMEQGGNPARLEAQRQFTRREGGLTYDGKTNTARLGERRFGSGRAESDPMLQAQGYISEASKKVPIFSDEIAPENVDAVMRQYQPRQDGANTQAVGTPVPKAKVIINDGSQGAAQMPESMMQRRAGLKPGDPNTITTGGKTRSVGYQEATPENYSPGPERVSAMNNDAPNIQLRGRQGGIIANPNAMSSVDRIRALANDPSLKGSPSLRKLAAEQIMQESQNVENNFQGAQQENAVADFNQAKMRSDATEGFARRRMLTDQFNSDTGEQRREGDLDRQVTREGNVLDAAGRAAGGRGSNGKMGETFTDNMYEDYLKQTGDPALAAQLASRAATNAGVDPNESAINGLGQTMEDDTVAMERKSYSDRWFASNKPDFDQGSALPSSQGLSSRIINRILPGGRSADDVKWTDKNGTENWTSPNAIPLGETVEQYRLRRERQQAMRQQN